MNFRSKNDLKIRPIHERSLVARAKILASLSAAALLAACGAPSLEEDAGPLSIAFTNREALPLTSYQEAGQYARKTGYLVNSQCASGLRAGMQVAFSASYGIGGEAGQSRGVLVEREDGLYYEQENNVTTQLLLPPGLALNSGTKVSLWEFRSFAELVCQVVFAADGSGSYDARNQKYAFKGAAKVDFDGGTAGRKFSVPNALEIKLSQTTKAGAKADFNAYFAPGKGLKAFEFTESGAPQGTFKIYFGD